MEEKKNQLTREGLRKFQEELDDLINVQAPAIAEKIGEARGHGDLSENSEYDAARDKQREIKQRIDEIKELLKNVEVVDVDKTADRIVFGAKVKLEDIEMKETMEYTIKGSSESNILENTISNESPLGKAIMDKKKGDIVDVDAPDGVIQYKVLDFKVE